MTELQKAARPAQLTGQSDRVGQVEPVADLTPGAVYFGGPREPAGALRDLLAEQIAAVPSGGSIDWITYYFRDRRLASDLITAHRRGVRVTVVMEVKPRTDYANNDVIAMLSGADGIGSGLRIVRLPGIPAPAGRAWKFQLHEKIYCFSHPTPTAFIGSFNPSGDVPEVRPEVIEEIGDQDRGHNALVRLSDAGPVNACVNHIRQLHRSPPGFGYRFTRRYRPLYESNDIVIHTWPMLSRHPIVKFLQGFGAGSRVRVVASHIQNPASVKTMIALSKSGADLEILAEHGTRRVTEKAERALLAAGVSFRRIEHREGLPMHLKFVLAERGGDKWSVFGSYNWTLPSYWINHEIAVISRDLAIYEAFSERWEELAHLSP